MKMYSKKYKDELVCRCYTRKCNKKALKYVEDRGSLIQKHHSQKKLVILYEWGLNTRIKSIKKETKVGYKAINRVFFVIR